MPVLSYVHQIFNVDQCQVYTDSTSSYWVVKGYAHKLSEICRGVAVHFQTFIVQSFCNHHVS